MKIFVGLTLGMLSVQPVILLSLSSRHLDIILHHGSVLKLHGHSINKSRSLRRRYNCKPIGCCESQLQNLILSSKLAYEGYLMMSFKFHPSKLFKRLKSLIKPASEHYPIFHNSNPFDPIMQSRDVKIFWSSLRNVICSAGDTFSLSSRHLDIILHHGSVLKIRIRIYG